MKRRIAVVIDPWDYPYNGTVVSTRRFVGAMDEDFDFTILATRPPDANPDARIVAFPRLSIPGVNALIQHMKVPLARPQRDRIAAALDGVDLVHVQFPFFLGFAVMREARRRQIPIVCSFHVQPENLLRNLGLGSRLLARWLYRLFIAAFYDRARVVIAPSEFARTALERAGLKAPVEVISNGVPRSMLALPRQPACDGKLHLLCVGRLAHEKQHQLVIEAVARSANRDRIVLDIIGAGPMREALARLARERGVDANIRASPDEELLVCYQRADLFIHAGEIELEGISVMEAMATGNAVLLSDAADSATIELAHTAGMTFIAGDRDSLTTLMDHWLGDGDARAQAGAANRAWVSRRGQEASVARLKALYSRLLGDATE